MVALGRGRACLYACVSVAPCRRLRAAARVWLRAWLRGCAPSREALKIKDQIFFVICLENMMFVLWTHLLLSYVTRLGKLQSKGHLPP